MISPSQQTEVSEKCTTDKGSGKGTCLDTVVAIGIPEELLEARAVEEFADQHLARVVLRNADALRNEARSDETEIDALPKRHLRTFSITFELNFCTESAQTLPVNWRMTASLKRLSFKSKIYCTT